MLELIMIAISEERVEAGGIGRARATFERCQVRMREGFLGIRSVEELAQSCRLDVAYLCRLYRRFLGETPYRVLNRLQMGWAAEQLLVPGKLVREIAGKLSLDPFQFSRTFKRVFGVSPTDFQKLRAGQVSRD